MGKFIIGLINLFVVLPAILMGGLVLLGVASATLPVFFGSVILVALFIILPMVVVGKLLEMQMLKMLSIIAASITAGGTDVNKE